MRMPTACPNSYTSNVRAINELMKSALVIVGWDTESFKHWSKWINICVTHLVDESAAVQHRTVRFVSKRKKDEEQKEKEKREGSIAKVAVQTSGRGDNGRFVKLHSAGSQPVPQQSSANGRPFDGVFLVKMSCLWWIGVLSSRIAGDLSSKWASGSLPFDCALLANRGEPNGYPRRLRRRLEISTIASMQPVQAIRTPAATEWQTWIAPTHKYSSWHQHDTVKARRTRNVNKFCVFFFLSPVCNTLTSDQLPESNRDLCRRKINKATKKKPKWEKKSEKKRQQHSKCTVAQWRKNNFVSIQKYTHGLILNHMRNAATLMAGWLTVRVMIECVLMVEFVCVCLCVCSGNDGDDDTNNNRIFSWARNSSWWR